jgi:hypothetical protein
MLAVLLLASTPGIAVNAHGLIGQAIARTQAATALRYERQLTGTKREHIHDISDEQERLIAEKEFQLAMAPDGLLHRLIMLNGIPISKSEWERPEIDPFVFITTLRSRYAIRMGSPEPVDGYYAVSFDPKRPDVPARNEQEMVINHLSGIVYIDERERFVRRIHAWLERPFSVKSIGRVQEASVMLDQELLDGFVVPRRSVFSVRYSKGFGIFFNTATRTTVTYEYDPLMPLP